MEKSKDYNKDYYAKNKERLLANACTKIRCEHCNMECSKSNMSKHIQTEKHKLRAQINLALIEHVQ